MRWVLQAGLSLLDFQALVVTWLGPWSQPFPFKLHPTLGCNLLKKIQENRTIGYNSDFCLQQKDRRQHSESAKISHKLLTERMRGCEGKWKRRQHHNFHKMLPTPVKVVVSQKGQNNLSAFAVWVIRSLRDQPATAPRTWELSPQYFVSTSKVLMGVNFFSRVLQRLLYQKELAGVSRQGTMKCTEI